MVAVFRCMVYCSIVSPVVYSDSMPSGIITIKAVPISNPAPNTVMFLSSFCETKGNIQCKRTCSLLLLLCSLSRLIRSALMVLILIDSNLGTWPERVHSESGLVPCLPLSGCSMCHALFSSTPQTHAYTLVFNTRVYGWSCLEKWLVVF